MQIQLTEQYCKYQANTRLLEISVEIAKRSISKKEIKANTLQAAKIDLWLRALDFADLYCDKDVKDKLVYCLADIADVNALPYAPVVGTVTAPAIVVGIPGSTGATGATGADGGGQVFSMSGLTSDIALDSFDISLTRSAEWVYSIYDATNQRQGRMIGGWLADGSFYEDDGGLDSTDIGDTSGVQLSVIVVGTTASLFATITSGTWTISGTRKFIPYTGTGIITPTSLADGKVWVGDLSNLPQAVTISGDITITNAGVSSITAGSILNADINASAAIEQSKLLALTASKVAVTDVSGFITTSSITPTELGYLSGATSNIQTQINTIAGAGTITGAITTVVSTDLSPSLIVISNALGKIAAGGITTTEVNRLVGVTGNVQTQIDAKVSKTGDTMSGALASTSTGEFDGGIRTSSSGSYFKIVKVDFAGWNMDTTGGITVTHGIDASKIISFSGIVYNNTGSTWAQVSSYVGNTNSVDRPVLAFGSGNSTSIIIRRSDSSDFDSASWNAAFGHITFFLTA